MKNENNNYCKAILNMLQAGVNIVDNDGKIIFVNDAYCKMHNYSKDDLLDKSIDMVLSAQNNGGTGLERYKKILNKEIDQSFNVESFNFRKDGSSFPVLVSWNYLPDLVDSGPGGMVAVVQDLTDMKQVEKALKENEEKYRSLVENISDFIWEITPDCKYSYVSPKSEELFLYKQDEMHGNTIWKFIKKDSRNIEKLKEAIDNRAPFSHIELIKEDKNGQVVVIESSGIPVYKDNKFKGFWGIDRDISAQEKVKQVNKEIKELKERLKKREYLEYIMGESKKIKEVHKAVEKIAPTDFSVIIHGETGTGKEIIANAIHDFSTRESKSLVSIDCGAIPESLIETELFGCIKGAYTGANETKDGAFQMANGGTLFLDEITNLSLEMQKKLLRVLQEREVKKVGGTRVEKLDIRIIAASNENILELVEQGKFRKDLYFRLNEFNISLPPLRERKNDIVMLAQRFIQETSAHLNCEKKHITKEALDALNRYEWPGNVRELKNAVKKAFVISDDEIDVIHFDLINKTSGITSSVIPGQIVESIPENQDNFDLKQYIKDYSAKVEKKLIMEALQKFNGNKSKTARYFNIDYKTLLYKIENYGI